MPRGKIQFSVKEKQDIVREAYSLPENVGKTARKYKILNRQIRDWKKNLMGIMERVDLSRRPAAPRIENPELYSHLLNFFHQLRERDIAVSVTMLCREARR